MNNSYKLNIYFNSLFVGVLKYDINTEVFDLEYSKMWQETSFPISPKLDFSKNYTSKDIKNYIENLFPEGDGLDTFIQYIQISKSNKFSLLKAIGNETSGALSFISNDIKDIKTTFREIPLEELKARVKNRDKTPIFIWDNKPRLSVAGVQEKLPICKINDIYGLADGDLASTHILKFEKSNYNLVLNKFLSLQLAKSVGLDIPNIDILEFDDELVLEVERFDRKYISDSKIEKLHIIDSCQALSLSPSFKYERNFGSQRDVKDIRQGVSFTKLKEILLQTKIPIISINKVLKWTIFNLIIGNSDAHGKNISFFVDSSGISIAPFYDILNILIYKGKFHTELAMAIDDEFIIEKISAYDIATFCYGLQTTPQIANKEFKNISKFILKTFDDSSLIERCKRYDIDFINLYIKDVQKRIEYLHRHFDNAVKVNKEDIT
ncbi:MAG: HipA domain-containing protein [Arcobacteraceae bacterium]|nr:HipA domain-containing protein [Arcobacteraceae bacterium]